MNVMKKTLLILLCYFATSFGPCLANQVNDDTAAPRHVEDLVRHTQYGDVIGYQAKGVESWLGIPFARPPVGSLRWRAPRAPMPWAGVRQGMHYGAKCSQPAVDLLPIHGHLIHAAEYLKGASYMGSEDCLYLNVQRPAVAKESGDAATHLLPVMVWLHGGANVTGSGEGYGTVSFLTATNVVLVTVNYRLGDFGFFLNPALRSEKGSEEDHSGNYGLLDQIQALRWVSENITAFGGDPQNVTVFGVSAGAADIMGLISSPRAAGLFRRAIVMSGHALTRSIAEASDLSDAPTPGRPASSGELLLQLLLLDGTATDRTAARKWVDAGSPEKIAAYLRRKTYEAFDAAEAELADQKDSVFGETLIRDGVVVPMSGIVSSYKTEHGHNPVEVMIGSVHDEDQPYVLSKAAYGEFVSGPGGFVYHFKDLEGYRLMSQYASRLWQATDVDELAAVLTVNQPGKVFSYRLDWHGVEPWPGPDHEPHGTTHGMDIPLVFGFPPGSDVDAAHRAGYHFVSRAMMSYWGEFARSGNPGRGMQGDLPEWGAWNNAPNAPKFMILDSPTEGGIRLSSSSITKDDVLAQLTRDSRLPSKRDKCEFLRRLTRYSTMTPRLAPDDYTKFEEGTCVRDEHMPLTMHPREHRNLSAARMKVISHGVGMLAKVRESVRNELGTSRKNACEANSTPTPGNSVPPLPADATESQIIQAAAKVRAGRKLTPREWKDGARIAVCLSFDVDNEFHAALDRFLPVPLSTGEYGATTGLPRILALLDRHGVPASFYVPAGAAILHPELITDIMKSGRHEIAVHGWVHEYIPMLENAAEEQKLLNRSISYLTKVVGRRPVGYRAPGWELGPNTLSQIIEAGFLYDSSMMARDEPYELVSDGHPTGFLEIPVSWVLDDYPYFGLNANGAQPDPEVVFKIFRSEFDVAYREKTLFVLTMHPAISGIRSRAEELEKLIAYMQSKPGVWFATLEQVARYIRQEQGDSRPSDVSSR